MFFSDGSNPARTPSRGSKMTTLVLEGGVVKFGTRFIVSPPFHGSGASPRRAGVKAFVKDDVPDVVFVEDAGGSFFGRIVYGSENVPHRLGAVRREVAVV